MGDGCIQRDEVIRRGAHKGVQGSVLSICIISATHRDTGIGVFVLSTVLHLANDCWYYKAYYAFFIALEELTFFIFDWRYHNV